MVRVKAQEVEVMEVVGTAVGARVGELRLAVVDQVGADDEIPRAGGRRRGAPGERLARDLLRVGVRVRDRVRGR